MPLCANCTSNLICLSCNSSLYGVNYAATPNTCQLCNTTLLNCITCTYHTFCTACSNYSYALYYMDPYNQNCSACVFVLDGCNTCSNNTTCLTCIQNRRYLYNSADSACVPCDFYLQFCGTCLPTRICLNCKDHRYVLTANLVCQPCAYFMKSCQYCNSKTECTQCFSGGLLQDKTGCSMIEGCIAINKQGPSGSNCIACDPNMFLANPVNGRCICKKGWTVGKYCTTVVGCTRTSYNNYLVSCDACNIPQNFIWKNGICECTEHYVSKDMFCK
jgi:hypothetical protein